jgi:hypothetical protein
MAVVWKTTASRFSVPVARISEVCATLEPMKTYVHAHLGKANREVLEELKSRTRQSESELVRRGIHLVAQEERQRRSVLQLAGTSVGKFKKGPRNLTTNREHLEGFGK